MHFLSFNIAHKLATDCTNKGLIKNARLYSVGVRWMAKSPMYYADKQICGLNYNKMLEGILNSEYAKTMLKLVYSANGSKGDSRFPNLWKYDSIPIFDYLYGKIYKYDNHCCFNNFYFCFNIYYLICYLIYLR